MDEFMTMSEIDARFPNEWILIGNTETSESNELVGGRVLYHSKDRDEMYGKMLELRPQRFATYFAGTPTDDDIIIHWGGALTCWPMDDEQPD